MAIINCLLHHNESQEVQDVIARHHVWIGQFWTPNKQTYIGLGEGYIDFSWKSAFEAHDPHHPTLAKFMAEAIKQYANTNL